MESLKCLVKGKLKQQFGLPADELKLSGTTPPGCFSYRRVASTWHAKVPCKGSIENFSQAQNNTVSCVVNEMTVIIMEISVAVIDPKDDDRTIENARLLTESKFKSPFELIR